MIAELPALPLHTAGKYVAGAYIVLFALVLIYVAIMGIRLSRMERDLGELLELAAPSPDGEGHAREPGAGAHERDAAASSPEGEPESTLA